MKTIHILLVEDNEGDILLITEALQEQKIKTSFMVARDGAEALKYLEKKDEHQDAQIPDIILLDVNLPKITGHELLEMVKSDENTKQIPVIMFTTSSYEADVNKAYKSYANCYITKPLNAEDYIAVVSTIVHFWSFTAKLPKRK